MATGNIFKDIFLAGVGAMAITADKAQEVIDKMIDQGQLTVDQGKEINAELAKKVTDAADQVKDSALEEHIKMMTPEERDQFASKVADVVAQVNTQEDTQEDAQ